VGLRLSLGSDDAPRTGTGEETGLREGSLVMGPGEGTTPLGVGRSEAILRAVAHAVRALARAPSWTEVADEVLGRLGEAAGVSRAYLFENSTSPDGVLLMSEVNEWCSRGIQPTITDPENHDFAYAGDFQRYV